jgi:hypothetical protein
MNVPPMMSQRCEHCGVEYAANSKKCWLCYQERPQNPFAVGTPVPPNPYSAPQTSRVIGVPNAATPWDGALMAVLILCMVLTGLVGLGLVVQDRGMIIPFSIFVGPAFAVTIVRGMIQSGTRLRPGSLLLTFFLSLIATLLVVFLLAVALVGLLFLICLASGLK